MRPCALSSSANLPQSKRSTTCEHQEISPRASRGGMHGAHGQLQSARPRAVDTNTSPPHPLIPAKSSCSEHSKAGVLRGRLIVSAEQRMRRRNAMKGIFRLCQSTGRAAPPGMPRRQRNSPVTRRDGVPARHNTAAFRNARYAFFGRISKSHGIAPTTSYIGTLKVLQPPFMSALTPNRLLSTFRTFLQIFKKSSFDRGEAGSLR